MPPEYSQRLSKIPFVFCVLVTLLFGHAFRAVRWSFVDTSVNLSAAADTRSWHELVSDALTKSVEYRPLLDVGTRAAYRVFGLNLGSYKILVMVEFALVLVALTALFAARSRRRVVAAVLALSVVAGLHTSRVLFLFVPLNAYSTSILIVLAVALLTLTPRLRGHEWVLLPLTLVSLLWLELGIFIVPMVAAAWLLKAPGTTWRGVVSTVAGLTIYLIARLGFSPGGVPLDSPETGLGFSGISADESAALFAHAPWLFWIYNVGATLMTVLASEPRVGRFQFIEGLLRGNVQPSLWLHVLSSVATTCTVGIVLLCIRPQTQRDRLIAAFAVILIVGGSLLGFLYTRDRIGLPGGLGYAMLVYLAASALLERQAARWQRIAASLLVAALGACWLIRVGETYVTIRDVAWDFHLEWSREAAVATAEQNPMVARIRASALKRVPADARRDPLWTYKLFERRYEPAAAEPPH
jgi:hypothetical protein